jgi:hypothetical protein
MKTVIYTALSGNYDTLQQPLYIKDNYNYICYSNDIPKNEIGVWQVRKIPYQTKDKQRLSRYPKMHPHILLEEYDYSVYMDANVQITDESFYKLIEDKIAVGTKLAGVQHPFRDCVYDEGYVVFTYGLEKSMLMLVRQMRFLKKEGFPRHFGMYEANIIFRNHHDSAVQKQCELWWALVNKYSRRDQLSYPYTLWKFGLQFNYLLPENTSARTFPGVHLLAHMRESNIWGKKLKRIGKFLYKKMIGIH